MEGCQKRIEQKFKTHNTHTSKKKVGFLISLFDIIMQILFTICQVDLTKFVALGNHQGTPLKISLKYMNSKQKWKKM